MQYASQRDVHAYTLSGEYNLQHTPVNKRLRRNHAVSEGLLGLAGDLRPEAIRLTELGPYALQHHKQQVIIYIGRVLVGH